jgi:outer membrane protein, heavy metal efflux system
MLHKYLTPLCAASALLLTGCQSGVFDQSWAPPRELGAKLASYRAPAQAPRVDAKPAPADENPTGEITLRDALALALLQNADLAAFSWDVRMAEAKTIQAGLHPNPELEVELDEFGGSGERKDFNDAEYAVALSQAVELGCKASRRARVARLASSLSGWDYESKRLDVLTETTQAFIDVLAAQEQLAFAEDSHRLAKEAYTGVTERVKAGKVAPLAAAKARVEFATSHIALESSRRTLRSARRALAGQWGSTVASFARAKGALDMLSDVPPADPSGGDISQNPDLARWDTELEHRRATVALEKANALPDVTLTGGFKRFDGPEEYAFTVGVGIPLPLFDRNQGGVLEAKFDLSKAARQRRAEEVRIRSGLIEGYEEIRASHAEAATVRADLLPAAQEALDAATRGFEQGKFGYLDVVDAQRTLFGVRASYVEALARHHKAVAEAERLAGRPLETKRATTPDAEEKKNED